MPVNLNKIVLLWRKEKTEPIQKTIIKDSIVNSDTKGTPKESAYEEVQEPTDYKFMVQEFFFKGKKYHTETPATRHPEILQRLITTNSFILKKS